VKNKLVRLLVLSCLFLFASRAFAQDKVSVTCFEDYYQGDALFSVTVDGAVVTASTACTARSTSPGTAPATLQTSLFTGSWGGSTAAHKVVVTFLNDAYGGSGAADRNLYLGAVTFNAATATPTFTGCGKALGTTGATLYCSNDTAIYAFPAVASSTPPNPPTLAMLSATMTVTLSFSASIPAPPATHSIALTWNPSPTAGVISYNIYRGTVSGTYTKLANSVALTYTDTTVQGGATYFYAVTAVASACPPVVTPTTPPCGESAYSNQASASVP
jgi:Ca-dependent carbohydrate-binding module xylan-binding